MIIPEEKIAEIKGRANIVEVVADFVALKKAGKNHLGLCPFHSERTPSFTVNEEKGIFHCFGCGAGGNVFNFLMRTSQLSFPEAVKELAKRVGVKLPERELSEEEKRRRSLKERLLEINEICADFYHKLLVARKDGEEGRAYLAHRSISAQTIEDHRLGFAPHSWDTLTHFLRTKGVPLNLAEQVGLILPRKEGTPGYFDRFRQRVIFPIIHEGGKVIGFGGRITADTSAGNSPPPPKYMNSPESPLYSKGLGLYGLNCSKGPIREQGQAVVVEGYMDLLSLYQEGIRNVVASLGTALTQAQVSLLGRFTREVILLFDADESGKKAAERSLELFLREQISTKVASLPAGYDPDSFIRQEKKAGFSKVLEQALPVVEYLLEQAVRRYPVQTIEGKVRAVRELLPALNALPDPLEQNLYAERIAGRLGLKESQVRSQLRRRETSPEEGGKTAPPEARGPAHERLLLQLMLSHGRAVPRMLEVMGSEGFSVSRYRELARELVAEWQTAGKIDPQRILNRAGEGERKSLVTELLLEEESVVDADRMLEDCLRQSRLFRVRQEIQSVDAEIRLRSRQRNGGSAEASGLKELLQRKQRLILEQKRWAVDSVRGPGFQAGQ